MRTGLRSAASGLFLLAAAFLGVSAASAAGEPTEVRAVPLAEVVKSALPDRDWEHKVCELASAACASRSRQDEESNAPSLYRAKGDAPGNYYAILPGPQLVHLRLPSGTSWKIVQKWDFSDYHPEDGESGDGGPPPLQIYPTLYPVGDQRFAVAVLAGWSESYSGGGGSWDVADFVELRPNGEHASTPFVSKLPFSCSKSIRACFSEHDYKHSPQCSEDFAGSLRLRFVPGAKAGDLDWVATWKETHWPGLEPQSKTRQLSVSVTLPTGQNPATGGESLRERVPFCEPLN